MGVTMGNDVTRLSVNINRETAQFIRSVAAYRKISFTEVIRRAISVYKLIEDETLAGNEINIIDNTTNKIRVVVLE